MAVHTMYAKGWDAGYKKGLQTGLSESVAHTIMERDLIFIYGVLALVLIEQHHWKQQSVQNLIAEIQSQWTHLEKETPDGNYETMAQLVERRTGIQLRQMTQDILESGWD